jgi:hypothetical protein
MRQIIDIPVPRIKPSREDILKAQGIAKGTDPSEKILKLLEDSMTWFELLSEPTAIIQKICMEEFYKVFAGNGKNAKDTPLKKIVPQASALALGAATLGQPISRKITDLFARNDFALASMLDSAASIGADNCGRFMEEVLRRELQRKFPEQVNLTVLLYSPGYCGWHISGQEALFQSLQPGNIGIQLNGSFLMDPLKSISGLLVAGEPDIHRFTGDYPFCKECKNHTCVSRMKRLDPNHMED